MKTVFNALILGKYGLSLVSTLFFINASYAYIVDSGPVSENTESEGFFLSGEEYEHDSTHLTTSFTLNQPTYVSNIETWMAFYAGNSPRSSFSVLANLYDATGQVGAYTDRSQFVGIGYERYDEFAGNKLFSATYDVEANNQFHWERFDIEKMLEPGTYWLELQNDKPDNDFVGVIGGQAERSVGRTFSYLSFSIESSWVHVPGFQPGLRVSGHVVPEIDAAGAAIALGLLGGLAGLIRERRRESGSKVV